MVNHISPIEMQPNKTKSTNTENKGKRKIQGVPQLQTAAFNIFRRPFEHHKTLIQRNGHSYFSYWDAAQQN